MGARSGGSGSGFGGGLSDAAISRMASERVPGSAIQVQNEPALMSGEIVADYSSSTGFWVSAKSPKIEAQAEKEIGSAPKIPSNKKGYAKYVSDYNAYHGKYMAGMKNAVSEYKKMIANTKNKGLKSLLAAKVKTYQGYMKDSIGVKDWINKVYSK